ncbi:hypothetical protein SAMN05216436_10953 [bacterium A37T11]|nr:hypothetical protein SAMN05216436_10953 [bacterium A37T11]
MEKFIPMIVVAVAFFYKAYSNFKKEQQKVRTRNFKQPVKQASETRQVSSSGKTMTNREVPKPKSTAQKKVFSPVYNDFAGALTEEELARKKRNERQQAERSKQAQINAHKLNEERLHEAETFDLRDAVIKAAILERPYR